MKVCRPGPNSRFLLVVESTTGTVVDVDARAATLGWTADAVVGHKLHDMTHPDDRSTVRALLADMCINRTSTSEARLLTSEGAVAYELTGAIGNDGHVGYLTAERVDVLEVSRTHSRFFDLSTDVLAVCDKDGYLETINAAGEALWGQTSAELAGRHFLEFTPAEGSEVLRTIRDQIAAGAERWRFECPTIDRNGDIAHLSVTSTFDPETTRIYSIERVVTERVERERELEIGHRFFELANSLLAMIGPTGVIERANPAFLACFGASHEEVVGRTLTDVFGLEPTDPLSSAVEAASLLRSSAAIDTTATTPSGPRTLWCSLTPAGDHDIYLTAQDITDELTLADELRDRATRDQLTRLATREVLHATLDECLDGRDTATAVVMVDLDDFKRINDSLGHDAGDELLQHVGSRIVGAVRTDDLVARFGGDEFVLVLRNVDGADDALLVADKVRAAIGHPYRLGSREVHVGASLGVTIGTGQTHDGLRCLREADAAAYEAKRSGRNNVKLFNKGIESAIDQDQRIEEEIRAALRDGRLDVDVQGVFDANGVGRGVEALVRLVTADGERRAPGHFLPTAQRLGLLPAIGEAVIERSFSALADWLRAEPLEKLSINADPAELAAPGWADMVESAMLRHGIDPDQLVIEATERGVLEGPASAALARLRGLGVWVAIDDFGTGSSSLGYIRDGLFNVVKIDRGFVQRLTTDPVAESITKAVVTMAGELGMMVVAEGIEDTDLVPTLIDLGCPLFQGFGLHRPEPIDEFLAREHSPAALNAAV